MRALVEHRGVWVVAIALAIGAMRQPAAAQRTVWQLDGAVNAGYTQITRGTIQQDPNAEAADVQDSSLGGFFTEVRPGISVQTGSPRLAWQLGYQFSGNLSLTGEQLGSYTNQGNASLVAMLTKFTTLTLSAGLAQGGTSFLLIARPADTGSPELRAPDNPALISASAVESLQWDAAKYVTVQQTLSGNASAPQNALDERNASVTAALSIDRVYTRDTLGVEGRASVSWLRPLQVGLAPYMSLTNALTAHWNRDFSQNWNAFAAAGVEQVYTDTGSKPLALLPTGSASVRYTLYNTAVALDFVHGTATNLQVGSVSLTDRVTLRGIFTLDPREFRVMSFSAGILHNEPLGEVDAQVAAGTGNAAQVDAGFTTAITRNILFTARYSLAYQFDQGGNLAPTLAHIALLGVTGTYRNTEKPTRPMPSRGRRVDGTDAEGFPVVESLPGP